MAAIQEKAAPGPPDAPVQVIDARDLAAFMLGRIEAADSEVSGVVGLGEPIVMQAKIRTGVPRRALKVTNWLRQGPLARWAGRWAASLVSVLPEFCAGRHQRGIRHCAACELVEEVG